MKSSVVTIRELSYMSGFSVSTVSKALNDKQDISIETRKAIKRIAKKLNYIPNNFAVSLRGKRSKTIAVILPSVTDSNYNQALFYLQRSAENSNYRVMLYQTFDSKERETKYINQLNDGSIDGIFVISTHSKTKRDFIINNPIITLNIDNSLSEKEIEQIVQRNLVQFININNPIST